MIKTATKYTITGTMIVDVTVNVIAESLEEALEIARTSCYGVEYANDTVGFEVNPIEIDDNLTDDIELDCVSSVCDIEWNELPDCEEEVNLEFEDDEEEDEDDEE